MDKGALSGSREPSLVTPSRPVGFDPARVAAVLERYGDLPAGDFERYYVAEAISRAVILYAYPEATERIVQRMNDALAVKCLPEAEAAIAAIRELDAAWPAIAMEARQGRDGEARLDPKDDSAGRQASPTHGNPSESSNEQ